MLAIILDVHSRRVLDWTMDTHRRPELAERALQMTLQHRRPAAGLILHHDRGSQYTAARYRTKAEAAKITLSMSRTRVAYDNAVAKSSFAALKLKLMEAVKYTRREDAKQAVFEYVEIFHNRARLHSSLGYRTPLQAERDNLKNQICILCTCLWKPGRSTLPMFRCFAKQALGKILSRPRDARTH